MPSALKANKSKQSAKKIAPAKKKAENNKKTKAIAKPAAERDPKRMTALKTTPVKASKRAASSRTPSDATATSKKSKTQAASSSKKSVESTSRPTKAAALSKPAVARKSSNKKTSIEADPSQASRSAKAKFPVKTAAKSTTEAKAKKSLKTSPPSKAAEIKDVLKPIRQMTPPLKLDSQAKPAVQPLRQEAQAEKSQKNIVRPASSQIPIIANPTPVLRQRAVVLGAASVNPSKVNEVSQTKIIPPSLKTASSEVERSANARPAPDVQRLPHAAPCAPHAQHYQTSEKTPVTQRLSSSSAPKAKVVSKTAAAALSPRASLGAKPAQKCANQKLGFKTHEFIVYPAHGVGQIVAIEEQEVAGFKLELFVISFIKDKMILKVPTPKVVSVGMRKLADDGVLSKALDTLMGRARIKRTMWSRRAQEYEAKINSGDLIAVAEVVRDLYRSDAQPEQSYSERQLYEAAVDRICRELAVIQQITEQEALRAIETQLQKGPRRASKTTEADSEGEVEEAA